MAGRLSCESDITPINIFLPARIIAFLPHHGKRQPAAY
jgi:hypothetical protein